VVARPVSSTGSSGASRIVNTELFGDQFAPQISAVDSDYLVVWTSLGQDGSREGVYAQFLRADGSYAGSEFRVNAKVTGSQMHPAVASQSSGRFLVVWSSYNNPSFDIYGRAYNSDSFVPSTTVAVYAAPATDPFANFVAPPTGGGTTPGNGNTISLPPTAAFAAALP